ncbi:CoA ester lyase [Micromonospora globispora]|nr:CoA ester lyase [Micromonospora globispora]PWU61090.1 CoA ester lyase [Micromonospora globispora]RQW98983.1 CoA ester lyase [Micromonospora globispora]
MRLRRTSLTVPGTSHKMHVKAGTLDVDEVILDLEDSVAPSAKDAARHQVVVSLREGVLGTRTRAVRINDATTAWSLRDVITVVEGAGAHLDVVVLPKVEEPGQVRWLDQVLTGLETELGLAPGRIGVEAQIEGPGGILGLPGIAAASSRMEALDFGPGDFCAAMGIPVLGVGEVTQGPDPLDHFRLQILTAARRYGLHAIDGPTGNIADVDGCARAAARARALGFDGKWVIHPRQIDPVNAAFSPSQADVHRAERILKAYDAALRDPSGARAVLQLDGEMIDEANRRLATATALAGRRLGMTRSAASAPLTG